MINEDVAVILQVIKVMDRLAISYYIGGSWASSVFGLRRVTNDADIVADIKLAQSAVFVKALESDFYVDLGTVREAINSHRSFNLIHLATAFKIDIFVLEPAAYPRQQMARRQMRVILPEADEGVYFCTAEDNILAKLRCYRLGGETSERQRLDVLGVPKVQQPELDYAYLRHWADKLGLRGLLERALREAFGEGWHAPA